LREISISKLVIRGSSSNSEDGRSLECGEETSYKRREKR
jgi:hypothetical protein